MKSLIKITLIFFLFLKLSHGIKKVRYRKISGRTGGGRSQNDLYGFLNRISPPRDVATLFDLAEYEDDYVPVTPSYTTPRPPTTTTRCPNKFYTVFEKHRKSLIQHCERSELRLQFEGTKTLIWIFALKTKLLESKIFEFSRLQNRDFKIAGKLSENCGKNWAKIVENWTKFVGKLKKLRQNWAKIVAKLSKNWKLRKIPKLTWTPCRTSTTPRPRIITTEKPLKDHCLNPRGPNAYSLDCHKFVNCWDSTVILQSCHPSNLVFNPSTGQCDWGYKPAMKALCDQAQQLRVITHYSKSQ